MATSLFDTCGSIVQLSKDFWLGAGRRRAWVLTTGALGFTFVDVGMQMLLNSWTKQFFDAIEGRNLHQLQQAAILFVVLATTATASIVIGGLSRQMLQAYWRRHLSEQLLRLWLKKKAFNQLSSSQDGEFSPEARIADDAKATVEPVVEFVTGFVYAVATFVAFVGVLWTAGGTLTVGGVIIPGFMVWGAIIYASVVSILMVTVGNSYAQRVRERSQAEAQFRYGLTRLRETTRRLERGSREVADPRPPFRELADVVAAWRRLNVNGAYMTAVSHASGLAAPVVPVLLMALRYLSDPTMTFGTVMQAAAAFVMVQASLAWVTANFSKLSEWFAAASRVAELSAYLQAAACKKETGPV